MKKVIIGGGVAAAVGLVAALGYAAAATGGASPHLIPYVGHLDHDGTPVTGKVALKVCLVSKVDTDCDNASWFEEFDSVDVAGGNFSLVLGQTKPIEDATAAGGNLYIRAMVGASVAQGTPTFVQLSGAQQVLSVPFAIAANQAADFRVEGPLHNGGVIPTNKELGLYNETAAGPIRVNSNGGDITLSADANDANGYSPTSAELTVQPKGVTVGNSQAIKQITYCHRNASDPNYDTVTIAWTAADCDHGLPSGNCIGMLTKAADCGPASSWTVLMPGEASAPASGGIRWYNHDRCGPFDIGAVYLCGG